MQVCYTIVLFIMLYTSVCFSGLYWNLLVDSCHDRFPQCLHHHQTVDNQAIGSHFGDRLVLISKYLLSFLNVPHVLSLYPIPNCVVVENNRSS